MTGQAAGRGVVCVERFARNLDDAAAPDNLGVLRKAVAISEGAPERLEAAAPVEGDRGRHKRGGNSGAGVEERRGLRLQSSLFRRVAIPARHSGARRRAVFVHLPATPRQRRRVAGARPLASAKAAKALRAAAAAMVDVRPKPA